MNIHVYSLSNDRAMISRLESHVSGCRRYEDVGTRFVTVGLSYRYALYLCKDEQIKTVYSAELR